MNVEDWLELSNTTHVLHLRDMDLKTLPDLPPALEQLWCEHNDLTKLPELPPTLTMLFCDHNRLTSLPSLPNRLQILECSENPLTALPPLPDSLTNLLCDNTQLTSLPPLPPNLSVLWCSENQLTRLELPNHLDTLDCSVNLLTSLPPLPKTIRKLDCRNNPITTLPFLPDSLMEFDAFQTPLQEPFRSLYEQFLDDDDIEQFKRSVNYYLSEQARKANVRRTARNLRSFHLHAKHDLGNLPSNLRLHVGRIVSGQTGPTTRNQLAKLQLEHNMYGPRKQRKTRKHTQKN
jgi:hypothetical protein